MIKYIEKQLYNGGNMQDADIIKVIEKQINTMSKGHKAIAKFIIEHYDTAAFITASKLGVTVGVSESTVVRFACALGFEGYPELQKNLQKLIKTKLTNVQRMGLASDMSEDELIKWSLRNDITSLRHVKSVLNYEQVAKVADVIISAKKLYVMGFRSSAPLAQFFWYYLNYIMENVQIVNSGFSDVFGDLMHAGPEDVIVAISFPRYSTRTLDGAEFAKKNGAKVIAITDNEQSPLSEIANESLLVNTDMNLFVDSLVAPFSVMNTLVLLVGMRKRAGLMQNFEMLEDLWRRHDVYTGKDNE